MSNNTVTNNLKFNNSESSKCPACFSDVALITLELDGTYTDTEVGTIVMCRWCGHCMCLNDNHIFQHLTKEQIIHASSEELQARIKNSREEVFQRMNIWG